MSRLKQECHPAMLFRKPHKWQILVVVVLLFGSIIGCSLTGGEGTENPTTTIPPASSPNTTQRVTALITATIPSMDTTATTEPSSTPPPTEVEATCGNGVCETFENPSNCPQDCAQPTQGSGNGSRSSMTIAQQIELPGSFYNGNDRQKPAVALSHDGQLVVNVQQPGQGMGPGEGRFYNINDGKTTVFWKDQLVSTGATWIFADPYLLRVSNNVSRGIIITFPGYLAEADGTQFLPERGHQLLVVAPGGQSAEASLSGGNFDFYDPLQIITDWDSQVTAVGWISALDLSGDGEVIYVVAPYVKGGQNYVALIQIAVYSGIAQVLDWQVEGGIAYPFAMLTTGEHARAILVKGNARSGGMSAWVFTSDYVSQWGCYPIGGAITGANATAVTTYEHVSAGPSEFYTNGGPIILGVGDYPWINVQYAAGQAITQLTWKEGDNRIYTFSGGNYPPGTLRGRWASYDGNHAVYLTSAGIVWHDLANDVTYLLGTSYQIPESPEGYNNYISQDASTILLHKADGDKSGWRLVVLKVTPPV